LIINLPAFLVEFSELGVIRFFLSGASRISLLQSWTPWTATVWNTPLWTVSVEAFCYFLFPFFAIRINRLSSKTILQGTRALWTLALIAPITHELGLSSWFMFIMYAPIFHVPQFFIGVCTGILFIREIDNGSHSNHTNIQMSVLAAISFVTILLLLLSRSNIPYGLLNNGLFSPLFSIIIFALALGRGIVAKFLSIPLFLILGEVSYAIYLLQNPILSFLKLFCEKGVNLGFASSSFFGSFSFLLSYLLTLVIISLCAYSLIEAPVRKKLISVLKKQR
jgi:peptidoglycan/LPS O-acetylase OafA/YrhL